MKKFLLGLAAGLITVTGLALATAASGVYYFGWNPVSGLETFHGTFVDGGIGSPNAPVVSGSCGTRGTEVLGATSGTIVSGAVTTCTTTLTFLTPPPTQYVCFFFDSTTPAKLIGSGVSTTNACSSNAATIVSGDQIAYLVIAQ